MAPVLALNIAGVLVGSFGWRSVFWFSPVMGALVLAGAFLVLVELRPPDADRDFDLLGAALAAVGLFPLLVALSRGEAWGWTSAPTLGAAAAGRGRAGAVRVARVAAASSPMIDLRLLRRRSLGHGQPRGAWPRRPPSSAPSSCCPSTSPRCSASARCSWPSASRRSRPPSWSSRRSRAAGSAGWARSVSPRPGSSAAAGGAVWMALASPSQSYGAVLPGLVCFGCGLADVDRARSPPRRSTTCPSARLGVASALPNISRYTGGALGAALLGAILHAYLSTGLDRALGQVAPSGRDLVADGFRTALLVAAGFLLAGAAAASRMPRLRLARAAPCAASAVPRRPGDPLSARAAHRGLPGARAGHARPHRAGGGARLRLGLVLRLAAALPRPVRHARPGGRAHDADRARVSGSWCRACERRPPRRRPCAPCRRSRRAGVRAAVGAGFTGRFTLGLGPVRLARLEREVLDLRGLLAGEERHHPEGGRPIAAMPVPGAEGGGRGAALRLLPRRAGPGARAAAWATGP